MSYLVEREILQGSASTELRFNFPSEWGTVTGVTLNVRDLAGTLLVDEAAAVILAATTLNGAITQQTKTAVLVDNVAYTPGDVVRLAGTTFKHQDHFVDTYTVATKTIETVSRIVPGVVTAASVTPRFVTYDLNASAWDTSVKQFTVEWIADTEELPEVETWEVLLRIKTGSGLESLFRERYKLEYNVIENSFDVFASLARNEIHTKLESQGIDLDKLVDHDNEYQSLLLKKIASDVNPEAHLVAYTDYMVTVSTLLKWIDDDQDLIKDDNENRKGTSFDYRRSW